MQPDIDGVLAEFDRALARFAPQVAAREKRPGVTDADLEVLREAVAPCELPGDLVSLLRWSDGFDAALCPGINYDVASAQQLAREFASTRALVRGEDWLAWPSTWLPHMTFSDLQFVVDLSRGAPCPLLMTEWGIGAVMQAPSLAAAMAVGIDVLEAGLQLDDPEHADVDATVDDGIAWRDAVDRLRSERYDWNDWPYDLRFDDDTRGGWPPEWRVALGLPADPDILWQPPTAIAELGHDVDGVATVEAYSVAMVWPSDGPGPRNGWPLLVRVRDATGELTLLVATGKPPMSGMGSSPPLPPCRFQFDVRVGPSSRAEAVARVEPYTWNPNAPVPIDAIATDCRPPIQRNGSIATVRLPAARPN